MNYVTKALILNYSMFLIVGLGILTNIPLGIFGVIPWAYVLGVSGPMSLIGIPFLYIKKYTARTQIFNIIYVLLYVLLVIFLFTIAQSI